MSTMLLISHEVRDYDAWKPRFDADRPALDAAGFTLAFVGQDSVNPNIVHAGFHVPSASAAHAFLEDPGVMEAMAAAGVISEVDARIVETA